MVQARFGIAATVTLWVLIRGFGNVAGSVVLLTTAQMQPIATYRTGSECQNVANAVIEGLRKGGTDANALCLPTGISDPVKAR
jgi:hypothetical protein